MKSRPFILDYSLDEWQSYINNHNFPTYRAKQIFHWLHQKRVFDSKQFSNLPTTLIQHLQDNFRWPNLTSNKELKSKDLTVKYLWHLKDKKVESVWLPYPNRQSACISVQSGCSLSCSFCATGKLKFLGNLSSGEILFQIYAMEALQKKNITNVVYMGMGEPFYNYNACIKSAKILCSQDGKNLSHRKVTISTSGIFPKIKEFVLNQEPYSLAISVHSLQANIRENMMDIESKYPIDNIIDFLTKHRYLLKKNQLTIEYILIKNLNMSEVDVQLLSKAAYKMKAKINLIPLNTHFDNFQRPSFEEMHDFKQQLQDKGVIAINRLSPGLDIQAACGMLAS